MGEFGIEGEGWKTEDTEPLYRLPLYTEIQFAYSVNSKCDNEVIIIKDETDGNGRDSKFPYKFMKPNLGYKHSFLGPSVSANRVPTSSIFMKGNNFVAKYFPFRSFDDKLNLFHTLCLCLTAS